MTRQDGLAPGGGPHNGPENTPRLRLKPKAPTTGHVDGAWWPHSDDLADELPDLLAVLSVRLGAIERVLFNLNQWAKVPRRLRVGGREVRLDGYNLQPINTVQIMGNGGEKLLLLVIPPSTSPEAAHDAMMTAAAPQNASTVSDLLTAGAPVGEGSGDYHRSTFRRRVRGPRD
jgi:Family of unknown function (DUF5994)